MEKNTAIQLIKYFKHTEIFSECNEKHLEDAIVKYCTVKKFQKGETVFSPHNFVPSVCIIIDGSARVNKGETVISHLQKYDLYGAAFLYNDVSAFQNTVTALSPLTVAVLSKSGVDELIKNDITVAINYIKYLSHRVTFLNVKIEGYTAQTAEEKLMHYLKKNANDENGKCEISVSMKELSSVLGISRASLYRVMDELQESGKIRRDGKKIYIL